MSAIHQWYDRVGSLKDNYNILVTVHSWMSEKYRSALENNKDIVFITDYEIWRYIKIADICIGDSNSLVAEFCLLNKPIITFRVPASSRTMNDVVELLDRISCRRGNRQTCAGASACELVRIRYQGTSRCFNKI
jgi:CDP-glycerol glycerophosphotransferase (TagB/SpsB family)